MHWRRRLLRRGNQGISEQHDQRGLCCVFKVLSGICCGQMTTDDAKPLVGIIMGSQSDWETMQHSARQLEQLDIPYESQVVSAHRTPDLLFEYASTAESRGLEVIIAGAGGAAHLPGMTASKTSLPVLGVPVESRSLKGMDSLLSIVQMPGGVPVATLAIGKSGAVNAALLAASILGNKYPEIRKAYQDFRAGQTATVMSGRTLPKPD